LYVFVEKIISIFVQCLTLSLCVCLAMPDKCAHDSCTAYCIVSLSGSSSAYIYRTLQQIHDYREASIAALRESACNALHDAKSGSALESPSAFYSPGQLASPESCSAGTATASASSWNPEKQQSASASASAFA
jgi:hypothetical protein